MVPSKKELRLSFLDQQEHFHVYIRQLLFFPFPDPRQADAAIEALRHGLAVTLCRFPYLAGTVSVPDPSKGTPKVFYRDPIRVNEAVNAIFTRSSAVVENAEYNYAMLAEEGFPQSRLPSEVLCPESLRSHPGLDHGDPFAEKAVPLHKGKPVPVLATQATFIPGGLVLSVWVFHAVADGTGIARIYDVWSEETRQFANQPPVMSDIGGIDRLWLVKRHVVADYDPSSSRSALRELVPQPRLKSEAMSESRLPLRWPNSYNVITSMLCIPSSTISKLKDELKNELKNELKDEIKKRLSAGTELRITQFVALASLIWAHIIRARYALLNARGISITKLAVVADLRKHLGREYTAPDYLGNIVLSTKVPYKLSASSALSSARRITTEVLFPLAVQISDSISSIDRERVLDRFAEQVHHSVPDTAGMMYENGADLYITSWQHLGADCEWGIPGTTSSKPTAIRRAGWKSEGGIVILPHREQGDAPYEVLVSLAEDDVKGLEDGLRDGGWLA